MKNILTFAIILISLVSKAQNHKEIIALKLGYATTNVIIKEAGTPIINLFGSSFSTGNTFVGEGLEVGISKSINPNLFIEFGFSNFKGGDLRYKINSYERSYNLKGFQIPLSVNYLFRKKEKKLRFNLGAGFQYFKSTLNEFESYTNIENVYIENQSDDIDISEVHFLIRPGLQYRIVRNLTAAFTVKISLSTKGRYTDGSAISVKYAFSKKD